MAQRSRVGKVSGRPRGDKRLALAGNEKARRKTAVRPKTRREMGGRNEEFRMAAKQSDAMSTRTSAEGMARIRVYTRTGNGRRVAMVGLIPREALEEIRRKWLAASRSGAGRTKLSARVKRLEIVQVDERGDGKIVAGRKVLLGVSVKREPPKPAAPTSKPLSRSRILQRELEELALIAERVHDAVELTPGN
jgi:hypothetical protein